MKQIAATSRIAPVGRIGMGTYWLYAALGLALLITAGCNKGAEEPTAASGSPETAKPASTESAPDEVELEFWRSVKDSEHTDDLWTYLEKYPQGTFADLAKSKIERLAKGEGEAKAESAPPPPPSATAPATRRSRKQVVQAVIQRKLARFREPRVHIAPDIPRHKLDNAAQVHNFDTSKVLLLYDDGFSGGGKTGFCLTDRKVYWRFVSGSPAYYLDFEDIDQVRVRKKKFLLNGYDVSVTMANNPPRAAEVFAELLEEIRDELR